MARALAGADDARAWLAEQARSERPLLWAAVGAGLLATAATVAEAGLIAYAVAAAIDGVPPSTWLLPLAWAAAAIGVRALGQWSQSAAGTLAATRIRARVRTALLDRLCALGPVGLVDLATGDLAGRLIERVDALEGYFARFLPQLGIAIGAPLALVAAIAYVDWLAASLLLAAMPLIPLFMALVGMGADELNRRQAERVNRLGGHFLDRIRGLTTLKLFAREDAAVSDVAAAADGYRRASMRTLRVAFLSSAVLEFFSAVAIAMAAIYIGFALLGTIGFGPADELTLFGGLFVLLLAPELFQPLRALAQHYHDRAAALGAVPSLREVLERPAPATIAGTPIAGTTTIAGTPTTKPIAGTTKPETPTTNAVGTPNIPGIAGTPNVAGTPNAAGPSKAGRPAAAAPSAAPPAAGTLAADEPRGAPALALDDVTLGYRSQRPVVADLRLRLDTGQSLLIVGPSGGGKSTLLAALGGLLAPLAGRIRVAGGPPGVPGICAWLGQRPWLVAGSIADNIRLGRPDGGDDAVNAAAAAADVVSFAERLPQGLGTRIGEGGYGLSGGQAQRVALARAFLSSARVVLLDEPTAKLDVAAAERAVSGLRRLSNEGRSLVIAGHDPRLHELASRRLEIARGRAREVANGA